MTRQAPGVPPPEFLPGELHAGLQAADLPGIGAIFLCALVAVLPLLMRGNSFGHDFDFHLLSWMETARQWQDGILYPHWLLSANYGAGEPRFIFYPPASWMLGALLGSLTNWTAAPILFILIALFLSGTSLYWLAREWMPRRAATLAACIYAINPYAMFSAYERAAYGELLAGAWLPLILLFALRHRGATASLALAVAGVWLTNAPAAVIACYALAGVALWMSVAERSLFPLARVATGGMLGMGLASFYLIPAAYERRWVEIARAIGPGMRVEDSFFFAQGGEPFHAAVLKTASTIAVVLFGATSVALIILWRCRGRLTPPVRRTLAGSAVLSLAIFFVLTRWSTLVWRFAPELKYLQFPWRGLLLQSVAMAMVSSLAVHTIFAGRFPRRILWAASALLLCVPLLVATESHYYFQREDDDDTLRSQIAVFRSGNGVEGTDEYTPRDADNSAIQKSLPAVRLLRRPDDDVADSASQSNPDYAPGSSRRDGEIAVERWQAEHMLIHVTTETPAYAALRLMDYPGWLVRVNSSQQTARPRREDGLVVLPLPAGTSRIEVQWRTTPDQVWGRAVTLVSLLVLFPVAWIERRKRRNGPSSL